MSPRRGGAAGNSGGLQETVENLLEVTQKRPELKCKIMGLEQ